MRALAIVALVACRAPSPPSGPPPADVVEPVRDHGWALWHALVQRVGDRYVWEQWPRSDVAFGRPDRRYRTPVPFRVDGRAEAEQLPVMFAVAFDPTAAAHVVALGGAAGLTALRAIGAPVPEFPRTAIALKLVWYPVHAHGVTTMPIWDAEPARASSAGNADTTWRRSITVDPSGRAPGSVPLDRFMSTTLATEADVAAARIASRDPTLARGDFLALVAMHATTKETPDWVWATYWWHDRPDRGPFARDRPATLAGPARDYLMDITLDANAPSYNPWLEARFPDGLDSNCVACHRRAAFGATEYLPVTRGTTPPDDAYFDDKLPTDFIWSLALESR